MNILAIIILLLLIIFINSCNKLSSNCSRMEEDEDGNDRHLED